MTTTDKPKRELTLAAATKQVVAIRRSIPDDIAKARQKVLDDAAEREAKVLERVPAEARGIVRAKADAEVPADPVQASIDAAPESEPTSSERAALAESDPPHPDGFGGTDEESHYMAQTKAADLVPDRLRDPLPESRLKIGRGR